MGDAETDGHMEGKRFMSAIFTQIIRNQELQKCRFCFSGGGGVRLGGNQSVQRF